MDHLTRFDVAEYNGVSMVVVESDLLPPDPSVVVIPLLSGYPAVRHLNPELQHDGRLLILATRLIAAVRRSKSAPHRERREPGRSDHPGGRYPDGGRIGRKTNAICEHDRAADVDPLLSSSCFAWKARHGRRVIRLERRDEIEDLRPATCRAGPAGRRRPGCAASHRRWCPAAPARTGRGSSRLPCGSRCRSPRSCSRRNGRREAASDGKAKVAAVKPRGRGGAAWVSMSPSMEIVMDENRDLLQALA